MIKRILILFVLLVLVAVGYRFWPFIGAHLFSNTTAFWISEKLSESISKQNELLVLDVETTRIETVTKEAWLIGAVQRVEIPYTFSMHYSVDMNKANIVVDGTTVIIHVPNPQPGYQRLVVDEANMKKNDWLFPLTAEGYAQIKKNLEEKLYHEYAANSSCLAQANANTVDILMSQYQVLLDKLFINQRNPYHVIVQFDADFE